MKAIIYTDGSCHTQMRLGAWACLIFVDGKKIISKGRVENTTHNRMEILAVLEAFDFLRQNYPQINEVDVISDSQYVVLLRTRKEKLISKNFLTKAGKEIQNSNLVQQLFAYDEQLNINFIKVKAHQKESENEFYHGNNEVDLIVRNHLRGGVQKKVKSL